MFVGLTMFGTTLLFLVVNFIILGTTSTTFNMLAIGLITWYVYTDFSIRHGSRSQRHIPRVPSWPVVGSLPYLRPEFVHLDLIQFSKELGPVFRMLTATGNVVITSNYEAIRDVCITHGKAASGRQRPFLTKYMVNGTGILLSYEADVTWKSLRMASHKHLKQFGEGLSELEHVITDVAEEMFESFDAKAKSGIPFNPKATIFDAALITIAFLVTGVRSKAGDDIVEKMREYESTALAFIGGATELRYVDYDTRPWVRIFNLPTWKHIVNTKKLQTSIWEDVKNMNKQNPDVKSFFKVLMANAQENTDKSKFTEEDVQMTVISLLLAGVTTTSTAFYCLINVLAHKPEIQEKLFAEVKGIGKMNEPITLLDRQNMPYCRAVVYELLRYASVVPLGVSHRTVADVDIAGMKIPADMGIITNLFALHHDSSHWNDPYSFNPERFLDENGDLVPADHPNRKNLMPFGAGMRVCLGEGLAMARLFLWTATFSQRYKVFPAEGNTVELCDPRNFKFSGVLRICPYDVKFSSRNN